MKMVKLSTLNKYKNKNVTVGYVNSDGVMMKATGILDDIGEHKIIVVEESGSTDIPIDDIQFLSDEQE